MLLDAFLGSYQFKEAHTITVRAAPRHVWRAVKEITPADMPLFRALFALRSLPAIITRKTGVPFGGSRPLLEQMLASGFVVLAEAEDKELVLGTVGQFWKPSGRPLLLASSQEFLGFNRADYAKAAMNFLIDGMSVDSRVVFKSETRVYVADPMSQRKFTLYWMLIRLGSGLIRRMMLRAIKRRAESIERES